MNRREFIITIILAIIGCTICLYVFWPQDYEYKSFMASPTTISFKEDTLQLGTILYNTEPQVFSDLLTQDLFLC